MRSWGGWLVFFAVASALLPYLGFQFILFFWIDHWGHTIGWIIRAAMAMVGIAMITFAPREALKAAAPQQPADSPPTQPMG